MNLLRRCISHIAISLIMLIANSIHTSSQKPYECTSCQKKFKAHSLALRCAYSDKEPQKIKKYILHNDQIQEIKEWKCPFPLKEGTPCLKGNFSSLNNINIHLKGHVLDPKKCPFPLCGKTMKHKGSLPHHMLKHTPFRPFKCGYPGCEGYSSVQGINVSSHIATHLYTHKKKRRIKDFKLSQLKRQKTYRQPIRKGKPITKAQTKETTLTTIAPTPVSTLALISCSLEQHKSALPFTYSFHTRSRLILPVTSPKSC